jgi:hypothetical protein
LGTHGLRYQPGVVAVFGETGPSDFPVLEPFCPASGQHSRISHHMCSILRGQNPQLVLTIPDGRKCIGGEAHGSYHLAQGGYTISGGPQGPGIGSSTEK